MSEVETTGTPPAETVPATRRAGSIDRISAKAWDVLLALVGFALVIGGWWAAIWLFDIQPYILPPPNAVLREIIEEHSLLLSNTLITLKVVAIGFAMAVVVGILLAIAIAESKVLRRILFPLLVLSQEVPMIVVAPIFVIWFGFNELPKILVTFLIAFFPMVINTEVGIVSVDGDMMDLIRGLGASRRQRLIKVQLPNALPYMFAGAKLSVTFAVIGAVVAEFVSAGPGLGNLVFLASTNLNTDLVFAGITILALLGIVLFSLVGLAERLALPWTRLGR